MTAKRSSRNCNCQFCKHNLPFEMPEHLVDEMAGGNAAIFAGAGISTEANGVYPATFYDLVRDQLGIENRDLEFPDLMSEFCRRSGGRPALVKTILDRFRKAFAVRETHRLVTRFHQELSTLYPINTIVTTNWDDLFERECDALPFVIPEDLALWNLPGRKVLKIHGSISNVGSLVATREDYARCSEQLREGVLGSVLKLILASRTVIYVGYSLRDPDFLQILDYVKTEMGEFAPRGFWISTDEEAENRARDLGLEAIITDATFFLEVVKEHFVGSGLMYADEKYPLVESARAYTVKKHHELANRISPNDEPAMVFALSYQDGLISAFDGICARKASGAFSEPAAISRTLDHYAEISKRKLAEKQFHDVAYIDGFAAGMYFFRHLDPDSPHSIPLYYIYGRGLADQPTSFTSFREQLGSIQTASPEAFEQAQRIVESTPEGIEIHHRAWL